MRVAIQSYYTLVASLSGVSTASITHAGVATYRMKVTHQLSANTAMVEIRRTVTMRRGRQ